MNERKPTFYERIEASFKFLKQAIKAIFKLEFSQAKFWFYMMGPTLKGQFVIIEK